MMILIQLLLQLLMLILLLMLDSLQAQLTDTLLKRPWPSLAGRCFPFALGAFVDDDVDDDGTSVC